MLKELIIAALLITATLAADDDKSPTAASKEDDESKILSFLPKGARLVQLVRSSSGIPQSERRVFPFRVSYEPSPNLQCAGGVCSFSTGAISATSGSVRPYSQFNQHEHHPYYGHGGHQYPSHHPQHSPYGGFQPPSGGNHHHDHHHGHHPYSGSNQYFPPGGCHHGTPYKPSGSGSYPYHTSPIPSPYPPNPNPYNPSKPSGYPGGPYNPNPYNPNPYNPKPSGPGSYVPKPPGPVPVPGGSSRPPRPGSSTRPPSRPPTGPYKPPVVMGTGSEGEEEHAPQPEATFLLVPQEQYSPEDELRVQGSVPEEESSFHPESEHQEEQSSAQDVPLVPHPGDFDDYGDAASNPYGPYTQSDKFYRVPVSPVKKTGRWFH